MKALARIIQTNKHMMIVEVSEGQFNVGDIIRIEKGAIRSLAQNRRYWKYLNWCVNNGLRDQGCFSAEELHEFFKSYFLGEKILSKGVLKKIRDGSTTELDKKEFGEYMENCDVLLIQEYGIDTSQFHAFNEVQDENNNTPN